MSNYNLDKNADLTKKEGDKYTGMREMQFSFTPAVLLCALGGGVLGAILSIWAAGGDTGIVAATVIVMAILSGIFGMFL
jgi:hypothetical protein